MRETPGLVDSLVSYIKTCLEEGKTEDKVKTSRLERELKLLQPEVLFRGLIRLAFGLQGVENSVCIMRNLSYQLYNEIPTSVAQRLEGPTRDKASGKGDGIGCFTPNSRKAKSVRTTQTEESMIRFFPVAAVGLNESL